MLSHTIFSHVRYWYHVPNMHHGSDCWHDGSDYSTPTQNVMHVPPSMIFEHTMTYCFSLM